MNKKYSALLLSLLLTLTVILSACSSKQDPKEAMQSAAANAVKMTSYQMKSKIAIENFKISAPDLVDESSAGAAMSMLKNAEITIDGVYQSDPMQTELTLGLNLKGDMAMTFTIPMVMTKEKIYIKVPSIPMFPIPENVVGKYIEMDLKELAEQGGSEFNLDSMDAEKAKKLSNEISSVLFAEYDQAKYFKDIAVKDANLPEGVDAKQVAQFYITNDNIKEAITIFVNKAMPNILDIMSKEEYRNMLGVKAEDIQKAKDELKAGNQAELNKGLEELKDYLKINSFTVNTAINKKDFPTYQGLDMNIEVNDPDTKQNISLALKASNQYSEINEKQTFKIGIPSGADVLTMEQFQKEMNGATY
ncbi:hypothetical protein [Paenibacillus sp. IHBB 10380]|uniref:hypothetical protein n=1 Tax=Paenibacillus sp. IHBB 10380 TaxID=1566358 RepID=UPI0005CF9F8D|nr:hypothetical protein [Paenibacillus sp. IHBB 10380]AJS61699.1 hypothetical protein UB51_22530 [Paenibacillus sp. IHBB 10380]